LLLLLPGSSFSSSSSSPSRFELFLKELGRTGASSKFLILCL
jgi:hypothetical protein